MAMIDDPNDPATKVRNKIRGQLSLSPDPIDSAPRPDDPTPFTPKPIPPSPSGLSPDPIDNTPRPPDPALPSKPPGVLSPSPSPKPFVPPSTTIDTPAFTRRIDYTDPGERSVAGPPAPAAPPVGGMTPTSPYVDNTHPRTYTGADGKTYTDDPNPNSVTGFVGAPTMSAQDFIKQYQGQNARPDLNGLLAAMKDAGYDVGNWVDPKYGTSHNEISLNGSKYKVLGAEDSPNAYWYQAGMNDGGGHAGAANAAMPPATSAFTEQIRQMLLARMGRDMAGVNETDSNIAQPFAAANLEAQRAQQTERAALAERAAAQGDTSGSVNMGIQQSAERNAVGLGTFKAKLIAQEYQARRSDLNDAMQQALASGDRETAYALQTALAQLDAQIRREGYGVGMAEFAQGQNTSTVGAV